MGRAEIARLSAIKTFEKDLVRRCKSHCELCATNTSLHVYELTPLLESPSQERSVMICETCLNQLDDNSELDVNLWHCLNETAWTEVPVVQVLIWRLLTRLHEHVWARDLRDQLYLEDDVLSWANTGAVTAGNQKGDTATVDSNGTILNEGDTVSLIKDLDVKGAGFSAKRGTIVKNIRITSNPAHIEGRVNKTTIVLKTEFLKKSN
ncbi:MAG: PhnA domain-containing protein [Lentisphaeria bacterium]|nr:PhnA domain-containing protein [Lentisphaeria bacterium]NQZ70622.1 PhnA domain-containing protein [Lentisphaeria bacterium]